MYRRGEERGGEERRGEGRGGEERRGEEKRREILNRPLSRYSCSAKFRSNTGIKHSTGKNKPSLVSAPIFRVTDQSTVKCHHFENCNLYKVLYGEQARLACLIGGGWGSHDTLFKSQEILVDLKTLNLLE